MTTTINIERYGHLEDPFYMVVDSVTQVALGKPENTVEDATRWALDQGYNIGIVEGDDD